jgi:GTP-binding protein
MLPIRNIAIIAHVDHGKTTLVDKILEQTRTLDERTDYGELILDSGDLERERGITITAKNVSVRYKGIKINILDTPGHSDFGGEVERVLRMADGVVLLVDAFEGPMPQTRFVTQKALELKLRPIVVINKVDKPNCSPEETLDKMYDLLIALDANEDQLDFPVVYGSGKNGWMSGDYKTPASDLSYLLDQVIEHVPPPTVAEGALQMQITSLDFSSYVGRIAIGRIYRGEITENQNVVLLKADGSSTRGKVKEVYIFEGLGRVKAPSAAAGEIVALVGLEGFDIGDTVAHPEVPQALPAIKVDEPTISMLFTINDSPFMGRDGKFVTSQRLRERLFKETERNLALRVVEGETADRFLVYGRGVLHLAVLIETMRREGYELQVGQPQVIFKEIDGKRCEPIEHLVVDVPEESAGKVIEMVSMRRGEMTVMEPKADYTHLEFYIPSRGLIGLRSQMLTATSGEAIMSHRFHEYQPYRGDIPQRRHGVLISKETGPVAAYALFNLSDRGSFFIAPGEEAYGGMIIGDTPRQHDLVVNVQKGKAHSNVRASGSDEAIVLEPPLRMSLEESLEYIGPDEYVEVTPQHIRLRKIYLDENERKRMSKKLEGAVAK